MHIVYSQKCKVTDKRSEQQRIKYSQQNLLCFYGDFIKISNSIQMDVIVIIIGTNGKKYERNVIILSLFIPEIPHPREYTHP